MATPKQEDTTMSDQKPPRTAEEVAAQLRLSQLELTNRMRLHNEAPKAPAKPSTPRGGFGSLQGIQQMRQAVRSHLQATGQSTASPSLSALQGESSTLARPIEGLRPAAPSPREAGPLSPPALSGNVQDMTAPVKPEPTLGSMLSTPFPRSIDQTIVPPPEEGADDGPPSAPSGMMPSHRPMPNMMPTPVADVPLLNETPSPVTPKFDPARGNVIGGRAMGKAPLPPIYHAAVRDAQQTASNELRTGSVFEAGQRSRPKEPVMQVPEGSEVTKPTEPASASSKLSRMKRFKNPKLKD